MLHFSLLSKFWWLISEERIINNRLPEIPDKFSLMLFKSYLLENLELSHSLHNLDYIHFFLKFIVSIHEKLEFLFKFNFIIFTATTKLREDETPEISASVLKGNSRFYSSLYFYLLCFY